MNGAIGYANADILGAMAALGVFPSIGALDGVGDSIDDLLSGDGDDDDLFSGDGDVLGAMRKALVKQKQTKALTKLARQMGMVREVDPGAVLVRDQVDTRRRYLQLGIPTTAAIAAGAVVVVEIKPQRVFRCEDLYFPDTVAQSFTLLSATVGQNSQLVGGSPIPLDGFAASAFRKATQNVLWDTANPGILIQLQVQNTGANPLAFRGELRGTSTVR